MSEDGTQDRLNTESQSPQVTEPVEKLEGSVTSEKADKPNGAGAILKLILLLGIVYGLIQYGLPMMNGVVAEFKKKQGEEAGSTGDEVAKEASEGNLTSTENHASASSTPEITPSIIEPAGDGILKQAFEDGISEWLRMKSAGESAKVKFINANEAGDRLAVEYVKVVDGDELQPSKELIFMKDEFGIFIYEDAAGVRQIRIRQPK